MDSGNRHADDDARLSGPELEAHGEHQRSVDGWLARRDTSDIEALFSALASGLDALWARATSGGTNGAIAEPTLAVALYRLIRRARMRWPVLSCVRVTMIGPRVDRGGSEPITAPNLLPACRFVLTELLVIIDMLLTRQESSSS